MSNTRPRPCIILLFHYSYVLITHSCIIIVPKNKSSLKDHCSKGKSLCGKTPNKPAVTECIVMTTEGDSMSYGDSDSHSGEVIASHPSIGKTYLCVCVCHHFIPFDHSSLFCTYSMYVCDIDIDQITLNGFLSL